MNPTPEQAAFLAEPQVCVLATADAAGQPHATPVWFRYDGGAVSVMIENTSRKHRNLLANRKVSLCFDRRAPHYRALMINGAVELDANVSYEEVLAICKRYLGGEEAKDYADSLDLTGMVMVRLSEGRIVEHMTA